MSPAPRRRPGHAGAAARGHRRLGSVRRAQLITTYGVGSLVAIENESFIVSGLDSWNADQAPEICEPRLAGLLGVRSFRLPPAPDKDAKDGVRIQRFPLWYSCPSCHVLQAWHRFNSPNGKSVCQDCDEDLTPSRFVVACDHGHLDDFPYWKWVHRDHLDIGEGFCGGQLSIRTSGSTASLRSVLVSCSCGRAPEVSLEGAFRTTVLRALKVSCRGRRPWLNGSPAEKCDRQPRTLQRGSSAAWYPIERSAISIPPLSSGWQQHLAPHIDEALQLSVEERRYFLKFLTGGKNNRKVVPDDRLDAALDLVAQEGDRRRTENTAAEDRNPLREGAYARLRREEYESLCSEVPETGGPDEQKFVCEHPRGDEKPVRRSGIEQIMLVKRLREVRALASFTRVAPPTEADDDSRHARLALSDISWLPAMEVIGEGVFLRLDEQRLRAWEQHPGSASRARRIHDNHVRLLRERAEAAEKPVPDSPVTARYVLLHTLAHVLINEWSLDGGYPTAALRERLYVSDRGMSGILIYTATSDSAGSLGGIVQQGEPERLAASLASALRRAEWCSMDPLCMESEASGADSLNLAACHSCVLLPETSCVEQNAFLDRALLVGTPDGSTRGFFSGDNHAPV